MIKDAFEDYKRYQRDQQENLTECQVYSFSERKFISSTWQDIRVGDIVRVEQDMAIPADLILLRTSEQKGSCFVETKNLDGETNLKTKQTNKSIMRDITE